MSPSRAPSRPETQEEGLRETIQMLPNGGNLGEPKKTNMNAEISNKAPKKIPNQEVEMVKIFGQ